MDTLILVSGGWRSAYQLINWLRTHQGRVAVLHVRLGDGPIDNDRDRAFVALRHHVTTNYPDRVAWFDASFSHVYAKPAESMEILKFHVDQFRKLSGLDIKRIITCKPVGLGRAENVAESPISSALVEIPEPIFRALRTCEVGPLPCGKCAACVEIETAKANRG